MSPEEKQKIKGNLITLATAAAVLCVILTIFFRTSVIAEGIKDALSILEPFLWGIAIAYLLHPICTITERALTKLERKISKKHHPGLLRTCGIIAAILFLLAAAVLIAVSGIANRGTDITESVAHRVQRIVNARMDILDRYIGEAVTQDHHQWLDLEGLPEGL